MNPRMLRDMLIGEVGALIAAASNTDSNSDILDMAGYEGVVFIDNITVSVATGVATLTVEQNDLNQDGGMTAITGAVATATAVGTELGGTVLIVEVYQPRKRYVQGVRTSAVANMTRGPLIAIRYGAKKLPITLDATVAGSASVTSGA